MSAAPCPRLFQAEAMRDGRLTGAERAGFERHIAMCAACAREVRALETLAEALRAIRGGEADDLRIRRGRTRLLAAFDRALVAPEGRATPRRLLVLAVGAATVVVGLLVLWRVRPLPPTAQASSAVVHADGAAVWSKGREGGREKVVLERGVLWIHVDHSPGQGSLVVVLPDGELEDIGTTFIVTAEDGHTKRVTVQEGRVVLRRRDRPQVAIGSGETWVADAPAPAACSSAAPPSEPAAKPAEHAAPAEYAAPAPLAHERSAARLRSSAPVGSAQAPDPSADFRAAMNALDVGDNHEAATEFASFLRKHPGDRRAEDAAYLRVIALQRCGDTSRTKEAALEYLRLYPAGFRRAEVERLAR
jgi:hypothetical protein